MPQEFLLGQEKNLITFSGDFYIHHLRRVFAKLHDAVNNKKYTHLILDFKRCTHVASSAMLPLCSALMDLKDTGRCDLELNLPENEKIKRYFLNTGWANLIEPRRYEPAEASKTKRQTPTIVYKTPEDQDKTVNFLLEKLLEQIPDFDRSAMAAVEWSLNEITDNVLNHSQSKIGGLVHLSLFDPRRKMIEFTISDAGVGIPETLRNARPEIKSDLDALMEAVKSGVTRNAKEFQGNGLYGALEIARAGNGKFSINSGYGALLCNRNDLSTKNETIPFTGTCIDCVIDYSDPLLLEKAISINGKIHKPVDYTELKYEQDDLQNVIFPLKDQGYSFRSRIAGKPIRTKLKNIVQQCSGQIIHIDFYGINVVSSSFADEVFGKLFSELGPMNFMQIIKLRNVSPVIHTLIDRAITQRMSNPHSD